MVIWSGIAKSLMAPSDSADQMVTTTFFLVVMWSGKTLISKGVGDSFVLSRCAFRALRVLNARVAALRAAVGCGRTYRRGAAWAWHAEPNRAFRRSCTSCLAGNYGASRLRCLRESTHEACEIVLDGFHAFLRTQYAMRQAEGAARGVTSLH